MYGVARRPATEAKFTIAPFVEQQRRQRGLAQQERAGEVHLDDPAPLVDAEVGHAATDTRARDVDEYVEPVIRGATAATTAAWQDCGSVTSQMRSVRRTSTPTTVAPSSVKRATTTRPMPPAAPDTDAIFARSRSMGEE